MPLDERVLVVPESHFREVGYFEGFRSAGEWDLAALLDARHYSFLPRSVCETQPEFKQLIPYVVLTCGDQVFHYRRGARGTETRITALRSVGIGGHIAEEDTRGDGDPYQIGMQRELDEEIEMGAVIARERLGVIYDPGTPVGCVHLGIVHRFELAQCEAAVRDESLSQPGFAPVAQLLRELTEFETWSQLTLNHLKTSAAPADRGSR